MICFEISSSKAHKRTFFLQTFFMNFYTFFIAFFSLILHNTFVRFQKGLNIHMSSAADAAGFADWCLLCGCQKSEGRLSKSLFCRMVTVIGDEYRKAHTEEKGLLVAYGQFLFLQSFRIISVSVHIPLWNFILLWITVRKDPARRAFWLTGKINEVFCTWSFRKVKADIRNPLRYLLITE